MTRADSRPATTNTPTDAAEPTIASDPARRAQGLRAVFAQDVCRVTVSARSTQVDMALPVDVPVSLLIPGIVDMIASRAEPAEGPGPVGSRTADSGSDGLSGAWTLSRIGRPPLPSTSTLSELGVRDGDLLVLGVAERPAPTPLFDDLMDAVARAGNDDVAQWTARTARTVGSIVTGSTVLLACGIVLSDPVRAGAENTSSPVEAVAAVTAAVLFAVAGMILGRLYEQVAVAVLFGGCASALMFTGGTLFVPGQFGAAHVMLGSAMAGSMALLSLRIGGAGLAVFTGSIVLAVSAFAAAACALFTVMTPAAIGTVAALVGLTGIAVSARLSMMQARLPLPPVPTAGAPLDTAQEAELDSMSFADLQVAATRARSYLTGLLTAFTIVVLMGVLAAAASDTATGSGWPGIALAALCALVLLLRGRTYAVVTHAVPLVGGGAVVLFSLSVGAVITFPDRALELFGAALAAAVVASVFGALVPTRNYSPVMRRSAELVEYAAIALVIPIAVWVCGLYSVVRGL